MNLFQEADVPLYGLFGNPRCAKDAAKHQVLNVDSQGFLNSRYVFPIRVRKSIRIEDAQGTHASGSKVTGAFRRVVYRRVDMLANQVDADFAAALKWDIGKLYAESLLQLDRDNLIFLRRAGAAHFHAIAAACPFFDSSDVILGGLVGS